MKAYFLVMLQIAMHIGYIKKADDCWRVCEYGIWWN